MTDHPYSCECCRAAASYTHGLCPRCIEACGPEHVARRTVTAYAILRAVGDATSATAYVQQTGGGCATVYVGPFAADGTARYVIGPGSFDWTDARLSVFDLTDTYIGPDDMGDADPARVSRLADITAYIRADGACADCGASQDVHLSADECEAHGVDTRDGLGCATVARTNAS